MILCLKYFQTKIKVKILENIMICSNRNMLFTVHFLLASFAYVLSKHQVAEMCLHFLYG
jgi:hypothetical protein